MWAKWLFAAIPIALAVGCGNSSTVATFVPSYSPRPVQTVTIPPEPTFSDPGVPGPQATPPAPAPAVTPAESAYDIALDALTPHCTQSRARLAQMIPVVLQDLQNNGVEDETLATLTEHLTTAASGVSGKTDCQGIAAAYAVLREPQ